MNEPVTVIIPAYNEQTIIADVISQIKKVLRNAGITHEIIVVDDGSGDDTYSSASSTGVRVIRHEKNRGYGASLKTGILSAQHDIIAITDADGTYPADRLPDIINRLDNAGMVVGARTGQNVSIPLMRRPAKWILRRLAQFITGEHIPDLNSGMRVFRRRSVLPFINILSDKFSFTTSITVAFLSNNYKVEYVSIDYYKRVGKSKIVPMNFIDFIILVLRLSMLFNPLKIFVSVALFCFALGGAKFCMDFVIALNDAGGITLNFIRNKIISQSVLMLYLAGLQILLVGMVVDGIVLKMSSRLFYPPPEYNTHSNGTNNEISSKHNDD